MTQAVTSSLMLGRRLDRLRGAQAGAGHSPVVEAPRAARRAGELASQLGGRLLETSHGPVAMLETEYELALEPMQLLGLPFGGLSEGPLLCLDLETTGLGTASGTFAFLVGLGRWHGPRFTVRQLVLADHADERALLSAVAAAVGDDACLVTYNGRSFDWPLLVTRFRLQRWQPPLLGGHFDLLPVARQLWRHRLANARLSTVEAGICGVRRTDDLPGELVPQRYFAYLRERRAELLLDVLEHNRQDIVSLALLLQVLAGQLAPETARKLGHPGDLAGLARAYARRGKPEEALACLDVALCSPHWQRGVTEGATLNRRLATQRAQLLARLGRRSEALAAWLAIAQRGGPGATLAWLRVASQREHYEQDLPGALAACEQAADACHRSRAWGRPLIAAERDLRHRRARLERRLQRRRSTGAASLRSPRSIGQQAPNADQVGQLGQG